MPTADKYAQIAYQLETIALEVTVSVTAVRRVAESRPMTGPLATLILDQTVQGCGDLGGVAKKRLAAVAQEARYRSKVCQQYEAAVQQYRRSTDPNREWPTGYPSWVD